MDTKIPFGLMAAITGCGKYTARYGQTLMCRVLLVLLGLVPLVAQAEIITGKGCYRYSDNESLNVAREIALSIAKRQALEGYAVFVDSTSVVENFALKNDLITSLTAGLMKKLTIIAQSEDVQRREICRTIQAEIEPIVLKNLVVSKLNAFRRKKANIPTGLPETGYWKALKVVDNEIPRRRDVRKLVFTVFCKKLFYDKGRDLRATWYGNDGIPTHTTRNNGFGCRPGDITKIIIEIPSPSSGNTYTLEVLR